MSADNNKMSTNANNSQMTTINDTLIKRSLQWREANNMQGTRTENDDSSTHVQEHVQETAKFEHEDKETK